MEFNDYHINAIIDRLYSNDPEKLREYNIGWEFRSFELIEDIDKFNRQVDLFSSLGKKILCLRIRDFVMPVDSLSQYENFRKRSLNTFKKFLPDFFYANNAINHSTKNLERMNLNYFSAPISQAREYFINGLRIFISDRLKGLYSNQGNIKGNETNDGLLPFTVYSMNHGLRILYSPVYLFKGNNVFGSPSTPVKGFIAPGGYIFGGQDAHSTTWEDAIYRVPPSDHANLLRI